MASSACLPWSWWGLQKGDGEDQGTKGSESGPRGARRLRGPKLPCLSQPGSIYLGNRGTFCSVLVCQEVKIGKQLEKPLDKQKVAHYLSVLIMRSTAREAWLTQSLLTGLLASPSVPSILFSAPKPEQPLKGKM